MMDQNALSLNEELLAEVAGGLNMGQFLACTTPMQAEALLAAAGILRGSAQYTRFMGIWTQNGGIQASAL